MPLQIIIFGLKRAYHSNHGQTSYSEFSLFLPWKAKKKKKKKKFVGSFFWRIYGAPICFWFYLTFSLNCPKQPKHRNPCRKFFSSMFWIYRRHLLRIVFVLIGKKNTKFSDVKTWQLYIVWQSPWNVWGHEGHILINYSQHFTIRGSFR